MPPFQTNDELPKTFSVRKKNPSLFCMAHSYANKKIYLPFPTPTKKWKKNEKRFENRIHIGVVVICVLNVTFMFFSFSLSLCFVLFRFFSRFHELFLILIWFSLVSVRFFVYFLSSNLLTSFFLLLPTIYSMFPSFAL